MNMITHFDHARVELDRALFLRIVDGAGTTVTCLEGCLWVTRDGCFDDFVLDPGQSYRVEDSTQVIACGFGPSLARVSRPAAQGRSALPGLLAHAHA
jgi:Protein of unknown function (DUF2917)